MEEGKDADKAKEIIKKEIEKNSGKLITGLANLQDTLALIASEMPDSEKELLEAIDYAGQSIFNFDETEYALLAANPRSVREQDRKKILPGQHAGVYLQFGLPDGTLLTVNFWGGLRTTVGMDMRDSDVSLERTHTRRTDEVVSQSTHFNWQMRFPGGPQIESWMVHNPHESGKFYQSTLKIDEGFVDIHPTITSKAPQFEKLKDEIFGPVKELTKLIPTSV